MTFARWAAIYLERYAKDKRSVDEDRRHIRVLSEFLGNLLLSQITKAKVEEFKQLRKERLTYRGTAVSAAYCNRELEVLRHILRLAAEEEIIPAAPAVRLFKQNNARDRILSEEEYQRLLAVSSLHLRRIIICAYETGMRAGEIKKLTWDKVDSKRGFIRLAAEDTKTNEKRAIPLSFVLREILEDIRKEQREGKVAPIGGHVFTWGGRAMSEGWKRGVSDGLPQSRDRRSPFPRHPSYVRYSQGPRRLGLQTDYGNHWPQDVRRLPAVQQPE